MSQKAVSLIVSHSKIIGRIFRYSNGVKMIPIKRHQTIDKTTANALYKQAGIEQKL